jgi:hypothetical protein
MQAYVDKEYLGSVVRVNGENESTGGFQESLEKLNKEVEEEVEFVLKPTQYDEDEMFKALENPAIKHVRVFKMDKDKEAKNRKLKRKAQRKARKAGRKR